MREHIAREEQTKERKLGTHDIIIAELRHARRDAEEKLRLFRGEQKPGDTLVEDYRLEIFQITEKIKHELLEEMRLLKEKISGLKKKDRWKKPDLEDRLLLVEADFDRENRYPIPE